MMCALLGSAFWVPLLYQRPAEVLVARAGFWAVLNQDRFSWSPGGPSIARLCLVALPPSSSPARMGRCWETTQCGPDPMASLTCHAHLKGGGREEEKLCGQLIVSVKRSSFLFWNFSRISASYPISPDEFQQEGWTLFGFRFVFSCSSEHVWCPRGHADKGAPWEKLWNS